MKNWKGIIQKENLHKSRPSGLFRKATQLSLALINWTKTKQQKVYQLLIFQCFTLKYLMKNYCVIKHYEPPKMTDLKIRHIFKSCNIYLKPERFRKSKFTLSKVKSE